MTHSPSSSVAGKPTSEQKQAEDFLTNSPIVWACRVHPTDWFHEVGCPHKTWTVEQLQGALESAKRSYNWVVKLSRQGEKV